MLYTLRTGIWQIVLDARLDQRPVKIFQRRDVTKFDNTVAVLVLDSYPRTKRVNFPSKLKEIVPCNKHYRVKALLTWFVTLAANTQAHTHANNPKYNDSRCKITGYVNPYVQNVPLNVNVNSKVSSWAPS